MLRVVLRTPTLVWEVVVDLLLLDLHQLDRVLLLEALLLLLLPHKSIFSLVSFI